MPEIIMSDGEFNRIIDSGHDGGDLELLKPEAKRSREAELFHKNKAIEFCDLNVKLVGENLKLGKENEELRESREEIIVVNEKHRGELRDKLEKLEEENAEFKAQIEEFKYH